MSVAAAWPAAAQPVEAGVSRPWHVAVDVVVDSDTLGLTYGPAGSWYAGDTHVHTIDHSGRERSSGSTAVRMGGYARDAGLDFIVVTDHDVVTTTPRMDGFTLVHGIEVTMDRSYGRPHVVGVGAVGSLYWQGMTDQAAITALKDQGAYAVLAHPNAKPAWAERSAWPADVVAHTSDFTGLEIYNHPSEKARAQGLDGWALDQWFAALSANKAVWGFSASDLHKEGQFGFGYIVVQAPSRDASDLLEAMGNGRFVAVVSPAPGTTSVWPAQIAAVGETLTVETADHPAVRSVVYDATGAVRHESLGPALSYDAAGDEGFLVVELVGGDGARVFLQPIRVGDGPGEPAVDALEGIVAPDAGAPVAPAGEKIPTVAVPLAVLGVAFAAWVSRRVGRA